MLHHDLFGKFCDIVTFALAWHEFIHVNILTGTEMMAAAKGLQSMVFI
jgi:hypothetical protein